MLHIHITHSAEMVSRNINTVKKQVEIWIAGQKELNKSWLWISIKTCIFFSKESAKFQLWENSQQLHQGHPPTMDTEVG